MTPQLPEGFKQVLGASTCPSVVWTRHPVTGRCGTPAVPVRPRLRLRAVSSSSVDGTWGLVPHQHVCAQLLSSFTVQFKTRFRVKLQKQPQCKSCELETSHGGPNCEQVKSRSTLRKCRSRKSENQAILTP